MEFEESLIQYPYNCSKAAEEGPVSNEKVHFSYFVTFLQPYCNSFETICQSCHDVEEHINNISIQYDLENYETYKVKISFNCHTSMS